MKAKKVAPPITTPATQKQVSVNPGAATGSSMPQNFDFVNRKFSKSKTGVMGDTASLDGRRTRLLPVSNISIPQFIQKNQPF